VQNVNKKREKFDREKLSTFISDQEKWSNKYEKNHDWGRNLK